MSPVCQDVQSRDALMVVRQAGLGDEGRISGTALSVEQPRYVGL